MSSRAIAVAMLLLAVMIRSSEGIPNPIEQCLRQRLNPVAPPPLDSALYGVFTFTEIVCKDMFRGVAHSLRITGELPLDYVLALCDIFGDDEQKVQSHVTLVFNTHDYHTLAGGRTCAIIRTRQRANPHNSYLW
ncbi:uncharacterized protein LOC114195857 [Vigna unguiculata]|uniref:Uncharacterized protein n=1 Tax=Vigna unguiculata TaxID=3917 RepID=A0A4D6NM43_VIGUN|nr:uncharacterized protein LOC114195857 [Vigna unguiculata]QCE14883.1 hypothetical protein DEO72_LG11g1889 [Vigna unguiculata]